MFFTKNLNTVSLDRRKARCVACQEVAYSDWCHTHLTCADYPTQSHRQAKEKLQSLVPAARTKDTPFSRTKPAHQHGALIDGPADLVSTSPNSLSTSAIYFPRHQFTLVAAEARALNFVRQTFDWAADTISSFSWLAWLIC